MNITTGKIKHPIKAIMYGPEGIGKSTFASLWPKPLFVDAEKGTGHLDIARTPQITSWSMLCETIKELTADSHGYKTLVIDTADWIDKLAQAHVCAKANKAGIEDFGYGKGWVCLADEWKRLLDLISELQEKQGMNILILAHSQMRKFELPEEAGAFDRWEMKTEKKTSALLKEWSDLLLFANYRTIVIDNDGKKKAQGGERVLYTTHHSCWDGKNRFELPDCIVLKKELPREIQSILSDIPATARKTEPVKMAEPLQKQVTEAIKKESIKIIPPQPGAEPTEELEMNVPGHIKKLSDLMKMSEVSREEVQLAVAKRGYYPKDTPIGTYSTDFVNGVLIAAWTKVVEMIKQNRQTV